LWNSNIYTDPIDPGVILIGELGDQQEVTRPTWAKDGSFMVFRKLRQFVPEFNDFLAKNPILDGGLTPAQGSELLGA
jgi:deferrochelatase/peroxidase EfeB